jgi:putative peptidoglycan lipid II flippase
MFIVVPASVGMIFLSRQINMLLFFYGKFTYHDVLNSAAVSAVYCAGIFAYSGTKVLTPVFYALDKAHKAVKIGVMAILINLTLNIIFVLTLPRDTAFLGLALGTVVSGIINFFTLYYTITKQIGDIGTANILKFTAKVTGASLVMGAAVFAAASLFEKSRGVEHLTRSQNGLVVLAMIVAGSALYFALVTLMKVEEGKKLTGMIKERILRGKPLPPGE